MCSYIILHVLYIYIYIYVCVCVCSCVCIFTRFSLALWLVHLDFFCRRLYGSKSVTGHGTFHPLCFWSLSPLDRVRMCVCVCVCVCVCQSPSPPSRLHWFHQYPQYGQNTVHDVMSLVWWQRWTTRWPRAAKTDKQKVKRDGICLTPYSGETEW